MSKKKEMFAALLVRPNRKPQAVGVPASDPKDMLGWMEETVGRRPVLFHKFREGFSLVMDGRYFSYSDSELNRAIYATEAHVNDYVELYPWLEDWRISEAGDPIGVVRGSFLVIAHSRDFETDRYVTRSMTEAEISEMSEMFADESTGRLEELKHELGTIVA